MEFLDRIDEKRRLERFLALDEGALACLYGRRRIGKSRLLEEVLDGRDQIVSYCALFVAEGGDAECVGVRWCDGPQT